MNLDAKWLWATTAPIALCAVFVQPAVAGEITGFAGVTGDGFVFADPAEGVEPPGLKAVTGEVNNDDFTSPTASRRGAP